MPRDRCPAPHPEIIILRKGTVLYEAGDPIRYTYFPPDAIVGLINVLEKGQFVEVAPFGREGLFDLISAIVSREAFGRYQGAGPRPRSRIALDRIQRAMCARARRRPPSPDPAAGSPLFRGPLGPDLPDRLLQCHAYGGGALLQLDPEHAGRSRWIDSTGPAGL